VTHEEELFCDKESSLLNSMATMMMGRDDDEDEKDWKREASEYN